MNAPTNNPKVKSLLSKKGYISEVDLQDIDLANLSSDIMEALLNKLNPNEKKTARSEKTSFSIYKEQNQYMIENKIQSLQGDSKKGYFQKKRQKLRNEMLSLISRGASKKEFLSFLDANFTAPKIDKMESFVGGSASNVRKLQILSYLKKLK